MNATDLAVVAAAIVIWLLVARRAEQVNVSSALALVAAGLVFAHGPLTVFHGEVESAAIHRLAEATLAVVLFSDASGVDMRKLRSDYAIPLRLLVIGFPLTLLLGVGVAVVLLPGTPLWVAAAIAAIVAPTDAALGAPILSDVRVPERIRRALNLESGLNDGLATPFVNLFLASAAAGSLSKPGGPGSAVVDLLLGVAVGIGAGLIGGAALLWGRRTHAMHQSAPPLVALALAALAYVGALALDANGFVATFVAGLAFAAIGAGQDHEAGEVVESVAGSLTLVVWFLFGAVLLVPALEGAHWADVAFAVLALTVIRMVPVALSLLGTGIDRMSTAVIGWFGPRGLASVVFTMVALDELAPADGQRVLSVVSITVALSVIAHGISASPVAGRFAGATEAGRHGGSQVGRGGPGLYTDPSQRS